MHVWLSDYEDERRLPGDCDASLHAFSTDELARRRDVFTEMWEELRPLVEAEVGMAFEEMVKLV